MEPGRSSRASAAAEPAEAERAEALWRRRFRAAQVSFPHWARDMPSRLLYTSNQTGTREIYAWDQRTGSMRQVTDRPEGTTLAALDPKANAIWWFEDDRGNEFGRWVRQRFTRGGDGPATVPLPPAYSAGLALGHTFAVAGSATDEGVRIHLVADGAPRELYRHEQDAGVDGLSRDEQLICFHHSEHGDSRHPALRVVDLQGRRVADLWDGPGLGLEALEWSPVPGDSRVLVVHERQGVRHPLIWDPVAQTATELKLELPGEVYGGWYPDGTALLLTHDHRGRDELYRYGIRDQQLTRLPTDPGTIFDAAVRPDGELWTWWTNAESPPAVRSNGRLVLQAPGDPAPRGVPYQDGTAGDVHFFYAEPRSGIRPHPTIFVIHGGPEAHDSDRFSPRVQAWVDHGFAVVMVNYRGSDGYGRAWRDALVGNPGLTELEDVAKVHDWMTDQGITDQRRTILSGASWGGYLTLLGIGTQPQRWPLAIADVPVGDYVAAYEDEMEPLKAMDRALVGGTPEQVPETYRRVSPITYVEQVQAPLLILAGENDPRCPIRQIDNYLARLRALGKPHEVYRFNAGHGSLRVDEQIKQVEMEIAFAARNLGTPLPL